MPLAAKRLGIAAGQEKELMAAMDDIDHLKWSIDRRAKNQNFSLKLLYLFEVYQDKWKSKKFSRAAQDLLAVSFSLWRAVFLANKTSRRVEVFNHGKIFLKKVIEDNAITYPTDKASLEWTFNYYTRTARYSLQHLAEYWPDQVSKYEGKTRNPTERWDYCQELLDVAVSNFENTLITHQHASDVVHKNRTVRAASRSRKAKSRKITLAGRAQAPEVAKR